MGKRSRAWLCTLGIAYAVTSLFLLYVYETYARSYVVGGSGQESFDVNNGFLTQRRTAAASITKEHRKSYIKRKQQNNQTSAVAAIPIEKSYSKKKHHRETKRPVHTCSLHGETISLPMSPDLVLAGAMKSGTSYFWTLLRMHPDFVPSKKFEAHFFDWNFAVPPSQLDNPSFWNRFEEAQTEEEYLCAARKQYIQENFEISDPYDNRLTYEKTPNYMFLPQVPQLIYKVCPWKPKIILILRNPVDRAYSHFVMDRDKDRTRQTFEEYIQLELETLRAQGLSNVPNISITEWGELDETKDYLFEIPNTKMTDKEEQHANWMVYRQRHMRNYLHRGIYSDQLKRWMKYFPLGESLMVLDNERLIREPRKVMTEVLTWLGVPNKDYFASPKVSVSFESEAKSLRSRGLSDSMKSLLSVGGYEPMSSATRMFLEKFYKPYNAELGPLLGEEWNSVWTKK